LEVRPIFLDHSLAEFALALPANTKWGEGVGKAILKDATRDLLPTNFFARKKTGFTLPIDYWMEHELQDRFIEIISKGNARNFFAAPILERMIQKKSHRMRRKLMWQLLVFLTWTEMEQVEMIN
jgi:asparagine synthase (glutamine-hydrolysing)